MMSLAHLNDREIDRIYIADTSSKSNPLIYVCDVKRIITKNADVDESLIPEYYRGRKEEVPIWFELASKIGAIDADKKLAALLGVPTIYFLDYDKNGNIINAAPQRRYDLKNINEKARWALLLSDIHLGFAIVTNAGWDAVDAGGVRRANVDRRAGSRERSNGSLTNGAGADGEVVWS
jgi:hypothetical protein